MMHVQELLYDIPYNTQSRRFLPSSVSPPLSFCHCLSLCLCLSASLSLSVSVCVCLFLSISLSLSLSLSFLLLLSGQFLSVSPPIFPSPLNYAIFISSVVCIFVTFLPDVKKRTEHFVKKIHLSFEYKYFC